MVILFYEIIQLDTAYSKIEENREIVFQHFAYIKKLLSVSLDKPYLRGRMNDAKSYVPPFELNKPIQSGIIAEVMESKQENFKKGDFVSGSLEWKEYQASNGKGLHKVNQNEAKLSNYLGILGMTGLTAYLGLTEIGLPKKGETLVVSGAGGAVATVVGADWKIARL